jgi:sugar phosphate isomerase/epimerase
MMPIQLTCSSICFRNQPVEVALQEIRVFGFETVELAVIPGFCPHFDAARADEAETAAFVDLMMASGLRIPVLTAVPGPFNQPGSNLEDIVAAGVANARLARRLGATRMVVNAGLPIGDLQDRRGFRPHADRVIAGLARIARRVGDLGLRLTVEVPHRNGLCRTLSEAAYVLEALPPDSVDVLLDVTHVQSSGSSPEDALGFFGHRVRHVHLRDGRGENIFLVPGEGDVDFARFLRALSIGRFDGLCALELEGHGESLPERRAGMKRALDHLRTVSVNGPPLALAA